MSSSRRRRSGRSTGWNGNQICLGIVVAILGSLTLLGFLAGLGQPEGLVSAVAGAFCPGILMVVPTVILIRSLRNSSRKRSMSYVVRSSSPSGVGYADITISANQKFPRICIRCGGPTRRVSPLHYKDAYTEASPYDWGRAAPLLFFAPFFQIILNIMIVTRLWQSVEKRWKRRKASTNDVTFEIPHCRPCSKRYPIIQRHLDFHGRKMIVDAHPNFRKAVS